jgi:hypothetical protein
MERRFSPTEYIKYELTDIESSCDSMLCPFDDNILLQKWEILEFDLNLIREIIYGEYIIYLQLDDFGNNARTCIPNNPKLDCSQK